VEKRFNRKTISSVIIASIVIAIFIAVFYYDVLFGLRDRENSMKLFHVLTGFDGMTLSSSMVISSTLVLLLLLNKLLQVVMSYAMKDQYRLLSKASSLISTCVRWTK